jgi:hypothetical protein
MLPEVMPPKAATLEAYMLLLEAYNQPDFYVISNDLVACGVKWHADPCSSVFEYPA